MNIPTPNFSLPGMEMKSLRDSEESSFKQESLEEFQSISSTLQSMNEKLEHEHMDRLVYEKEQDKLKKRDTIRFWLTIVITAIGSIAAIISAIATILLN